MSIHKPVVIVSADPKTHELYARVLSDARTVAVGVDSWRDVLTLARKMSLGAVLVDVLTASDWQSCRMLRERQETSDVPVVALTGWAAPDRYRQLAWSVGCAAYITKPCSPETVLQTIDRVTNGEHGIEVIAHH